MAKTKIKFRASSVEGREGTLYYQVIHRRVVRQIPCGHKLFPDEWDPGKADIRIPCGGQTCRVSYLRSVKESVREDIRHLKKVIVRLERKHEPYTADDVVKAFLYPSEEGSFISFARGLVMSLRKLGRERTAETYATSVNSFERFRKGKDMPLDDVDPDLMAGYESYLRSCGVCPNTSSFYMRNLRAIYNRAVEKGLTEARNPFKHVYTGIDKTVKRAVSIEIIRRIRDLDLTLKPSMGFARDIFMFSFYTRGMSFVDIAFLKKSDLQNGILSYRRHKTNQQLFVKWEKPMQDIVDKYDTEGSPYLLPVLGAMCDDERRHYKNQAHRVNKYLKKIGEKIGLSIPLTTYVARHGWASIAKSKNIPISTISEAMGHDSETTTLIYLASLDTSAVDKANLLILKSL